MSYNQTEQLIEDRDGLGNDPGNEPHTESESHPRSNGQEASLMHVVRALATEDANVDVLAGNVAEDDTRNDNLSHVSQM